MRRLVVLIFFIIPALSFAQRKHVMELIGGLAINSGDAGYNVSLAHGLQWRHFGMAAYTSFVNTPKKFSNWTIIGLQTKVLGGEGDIKPYGVFDFGLFNLQTIGEKVNMRTASLDLGAGVDKVFKNGNGFLIDARMKWLVDYAGKKDAIKVFTLGIGLRF